MQRPSRPRYSFTFADIFAGIGGMRIPFQELGGRCVFSSEIDDSARMTYVKNFGELPHGDITGIKPALIPDHDVLVAGFPCQPFSIAGVSKKNALKRPHGFDDETQGTLFFNLKKIIQEKAPAAFLLENVKHLQRHDKGRTYRVIVETLRDKLKYRLFDRVIDAQYFVPQHRERIFLVGFREDVKFDFGSLPRRVPKLHTILNDDVPAKYTLTDHLWNYLQRYAEKHRAAGNGFGFGLVGPDEVARTLSARYYKDGSEILIKQPGKNPRRLTPRECARLMGFPESFKIVVSDTPAYKQFGNAVVVPVVRTVATRMLECLAQNGIIAEQKHVERKRLRDASSSGDVPTTPLFPGEEPVAVSMH